MRRRRLPPSLVLVIIGAGCLTSGISYSPDKDDEAMIQIESQWSAPSGLTVSFCEDLAAVVDTNSCQVEHVVRGDGRGSSHEEERGIGCGGCPSSTIAYITGTISGPGITGTPVVKGEVRLGGLGDENPYEYPWQVNFTCQGGVTCSFRGTLEEDGTLELISYDPATNMEVTQVLGGPVASSCP